MLYVEPWAVAFARYSGFLQQMAIHDLAAIWQKKVT